MKTHTQKQKFYFAKEQKISISTQKNENLFFFLSYLFVGSLLLVFGGYFLTYFHHKPNPSIPTHSVYSTSSPIIYSDSLLVRLMDGPHFRLSKVDISIEVDNVHAKTEIKKSIHKVRNHLVFILSAQKKSAFADQHKKNLLKEKIIQQLNMFLVAGRVEKVQLKQTFLN